jgi:hypothetical protein
MKGATALKPGAFGVQTFRSERKFSAKLQHARIVGTGHLAEVPIIEAIIDCVKFRVVESVEGLEPKLELDLFCEREILKK